jgi:heme O synthase-like polyprenyltransferase
MAISTLLLIAAIVAFVMRAPGAGDAFLAIMAALGVVVLAASITARNRAQAVTLDDQRPGSGRPS